MKRWRYLFVVIVLTFASFTYADVIEQEDFKVEIWFGDKSLTKDFQIEISYLNGIEIIDSNELEKIIQTVDDHDLPDYKIRAVPLNDLKNKAYYSDWVEVRVEEDGYYIGDEKVDRIDLYLNYPSDHEVAFRALDFNDKKKNEIAYSLVKFDTSQFIDDMYCEEGIVHIKNLEDGQYYFLIQSIDYKVKGHTSLLSIQVSNGQISVDGHNDKVIDLPILQSSGFFNMGLSDLNGHYSGLTSSEQYGVISLEKPYYKLVPNDAGQLVFSGDVFIPLFGDHYKEISLDLKDDTNQYVLPFPQKIISLSDVRINSKNAFGADYYAIPQGQGMAYVVDGDVKVPLEKGRIYIDQKSSLPVVFEIKNGFFQYGGLIDTNGINLIALPDEEHVHYYDESDPVTIDLTPERLADPFDVVLNLNVKEDQFEYLFTLRDSEYNAVNNFSVGVETIENGSYELKYKIENNQLGVYSYDNVKRLFLSSTDPKQPLISGRVNFGSNRDATAYLNYADVNIPIINESGEALEDLGLQLAVYYIDPVSEELVGVSGLYTDHSFKIKDLGKYGMNILYKGRLISQDTYYGNELEIRTEQPSTLHVTPCIVPKKQAQLNVMMDGKPLDEDFTMFLKSLENGRNYYTGSANYNQYLAGINEGNYELQIKLLNEKEGYLTKITKRITINDAFQVLDVDFVKQTSGDNKKISVYKDGLVINSDAFHSISVDVLKDNNYEYLYLDCKIEEILKHLQAGQYRLKAIPKIDEIPTYLPSKYFYVTVEENGTLKDENGYVIENIELHLQKQAESNDKAIPVVFSDLSGITYVDVITETGKIYDILSINGYVIFGDLEDGRYYLNYESKIFETMGSTGTSQLYAFDVVNGQIDWSIFKDGIKLHTVDLTVSLLEPTGNNWDAKAYVFQKIGDGKKLIGVKSLSLNYVNFSKSILDPGLYEIIIASDDGQHYTLPYEFSSSEDFFIRERLEFKSNAGDVVPPTISFGFDENITSDKTFIPTVHVTDNKGVSSTQYFLNGQAFDITKGINKSGTSTLKVIAKDTSNIIEEAAYTFTLRINNEDNSGEVVNPPGPIIPPSPVIPPVPVATGTLNLSKENLILEYGTEAVETSYTLVATLKNSKDDLEWFSSDESIIKVKDGVISAEGIGKAIITVKAGTLESKCSVEVVLVGEEETPLGAVYKPYISGYSDQTFKPESSITRAEVATILAQILNLEINKNRSSEFIDVKDTHWAKDYINAIKDTGIFSGYPDQSFKPSAVISRVEISQVVYNLMDYLELEVQTKNVENLDIPAWSQKAVYNLFNNGYNVAFLGNQFNPNYETKRGEAVYLINQVLKIQPLESKVPYFKDVDSDYRFFKEIEAAAKRK